MFVIMPTIAASASSTLSERRGADDVAVVTAAPGQLSYPQPKLLTTVPSVSPRGGASEDPLP
jgi:hypothetical protein